MVRSMIAGVAGLKAHQSKMDVIGNNISNVNTWGFKSYSYNFQDAMYTNSINSTGGSTLAGAAGGHNASQVGYGSTMSSISNEFNTGAPSPSANSLDCMIDGTGFFLVGNMINGTFTNVEGSGLFLSRVGIFRVDNNGYLVDNQGSYVYGYAVNEGTGTPEVPARAAEYKVTNTAVTVTPSGTTAGVSRVTIGGITIETTETDFQEQVEEWIRQVAGQKWEGATGSDPAVDTDLQTPPNGVTNQNTFADYNIALNNYQEAATGGGGTVNLTVTKRTTGENPDGLSNMSDAFVPTQNNPNNARVETLVAGNSRTAGVEAVYSDTLSTIRIPIDQETRQRYDIQSYTINEDGTIMGVDRENRTIAIGQLALASVENPNGLEKQSGYYYTIGANAGDVEAIHPNGGPVGKIKGGWLEMANVDLANEFSNMITTQRGFQANSKIITVTDEMLQELVNMKR